MDKLNQSGYAVKHSPQGLTGTARLVGNVLVPINNSGGRLLLVGNSTPELICDCSTIPFPHFISECAIARDRAGALKEQLRND